MNLKPLFCSAMLGVSLLGFVTLVSASSMPPKTLKPAFGAQATDVWQIECPATSWAGDTAYFQVEVQDRTPASANILSLTVVKGTLAATTSDNHGGDSQLSPPIRVYGGNGIYTLLVNHTQSGGKVYSFNYFCITANGDFNSAGYPPAPAQDN